MQSANTRDLQHSVTQTIKKFGSSQFKGVKKMRTYDIVYGCPPGSDAGTEGARGPQYLADEFTLFQPQEGRLSPPITTAPPPPCLTDQLTLFQPTFVTFRFVFL